MEDYVYILDYLPTGRPGYRRGPISYGIGEKQFTLLELIPKPNVSLNIGERVYVGKELEKREKITKVKGRVNYEDLTIVGIGASAGGFEAFQKFLPKLSKNKNISYVIAQHLDPKQLTLFGELLSKYSSFEIIPVEDGKKIESNHIYYCPPNKDVTCLLYTSPSPRD